MSNNFGINYDASQKLEEKIKLLPGKAEYAINEYLWSDAGTILEKEVYSRMPRSKYQHSKNMPRAHAKDTQSLEVFKGIHLMIKVETKVKPKSKDYGYLVFPNEGRGIKQVNNGKQEFFEKALDSKENEITNGLVNHLSKKIEEEL